jgi:hypothetical protein
MSIARRLLLFGAVLTLVVGCASAEAFAAPAGRSGTTTTELSASIEWAQQSGSHRQEGWLQVIRTTGSYGRVSGALSDFRCGHGSCVFDGGRELSASRVSFTVDPRPGLLEAHFKGPIAVGGTKFLLMADVRLVAAGGLQHEHMTYESWLHGRYRSVVTDTRSRLMRTTGTVGGGAVSRGWLMKIVTTTIE